MKKPSSLETVSAAVLFLSSASFLNAQSTTVEAVPGINGTAVPSASSILNPHVTEGLFGTTTTGGYLAPSGEEGRFSSNALMTPSGGFIGMQSDADKARTHGNLQGTNSENYGLSDRDQLLMMRRLRNTANTQSEPEPVLSQRSAQPYTEEELYGTPVAETPAQTSQPVQQNLSAQQPAYEPERQPVQSEEIWMRGSSRRQAKVPKSQEIFSGVIGPENAGIDSAWYSFGEPDQSDVSEQSEQSGESSAANEPETWSDETGGYIGGQFQMEQSAQTPSASLARNGRKETRQVIQKQEQLETLLLQSPIVNPLSPIRVLLQGSSAVVTGVVPNEDAKIEAGKILLQNEGIESVDNRLAVCGADTEENSGTEQN